MPRVSVLHIQQFLNRLDVLLAQILIWLLPIFRFELLPSECLELVYLLFKNFIHQFFCCTEFVVGIVSDGFQSLIYNITKKIKLGI